MKRKLPKRSIALIAAVCVSGGLAACGSGDNSGAANISGAGTSAEASGASGQETQSTTASQSADNAGTSNGLESSASSNTVAPSADGTAGNIFADSAENQVKAAVVPYEGELTEITIALPSKELHTKPNSMYDRLVAEIEEHTGLKVNWQWYDTATYYEQLEQDILAENVADIILTDRSEVFLKAAEAGLFWEIGPYIDEYDNLATIPELSRAGGSYNGKMYGIPQKNDTGEYGLTYRADWLKNLGLKEPTDWDAFCEMLHAFTYNDPDGNGADDTVGLVLDPDYTCLDVMESWFGVPNSWGVDENGDLIHKSQTAQYKAAYTAFRELYEKGLLNNGSNGIADFRELEGNTQWGWDALRWAYKGGRAGSTVNWLYNVCGVWDDMVEEEMISADDNIFALQSSVDTGYGELVYPFGGDGVGKMLAISTTRIKDVEQMKQALQFLNDINDEKMLNIMANGWEGEQYTVDENGVVEFMPGGIDEKNFEEFTTYSVGFGGIVHEYVAEENRAPLLTEWERGLLWQTRNQLMAENEGNYVINAGYQFLNTEELSQVQELEALLLDAELQYITGEIDEAGFEAALAEWMKNGGEEMTRKLNAKYYAAGV